MQKVETTKSALTGVTNFKKDAAYKFMTFLMEGLALKLDDLSSDRSFEDFLARLPADQCRYAIYRVEFLQKDGRPNAKLVKVFWTPNGASTAEKDHYMNYQIGFNKLSGKAATVIATDYSQLSEAVLEDALGLINAEVVPSTVEYR